MVRYCLSNSLAETPEFFLPHFHLTGHCKPIAFVSITSSLPVGHRTSADAFTECGAGILASKTPVMTCTAEKLLKRAGTRLSRHPSDA